MNMEKEVIEGNKIIAEFKGWEFRKVDDTTIEVWHHSEDGSELMWRDSIYYLERTLLPSLKYHTSWDWLHPVITKIKSLPPAMSEGGVWEEFKTRKRQVTDMRICVEIEHAFAYVVAFIKWYNSTPQLKAKE